MFHDTQPAHLSAHPDAHGATDPWAEFRVVDTSDVHDWLHQVQTAGVPVVLATPSGVSLPVLLWSVDSHSGRLSFSADAPEPALHALVESNEVAAVTYLDRVKLQFELEHLVLVRSERSQALQAAWPRVLYRFQRRDSFRVRPGGVGAPTATLRHPSCPDMLLELRLLDLSVGGCALLLPQDLPAVPPGLVIHGVQVVLDASTAFVASVELHHISSMSGNQAGQRLGCSWHKLPPDAERALQRYVNQTQKRQRLLSLE